MLPYLARFAPTRGRTSGFQTLLVFDDCGITLEIFVCFLFLLSAVLRSTGGEESPSGFAAFWGLAAGVEEGDRLHLCQTKHPQKTPKQNQAHLPFNLDFFCFAKE